MISVKHVRKINSIFLRHPCLQKVTIGFFVMVFFVTIYVFCVSKSFLGESFFGGIKPLYNITLAEFFYKQSLRFDHVAGKPEPYVHYQLGRIYFVEGRLGEAHEELLSELAYYPHNDHTYYMLGLVLGYMNREEDAINAFRKYIAYQPATWAGRNDMAWLQFRIGDMDGALQTMWSAYQMYPDNPWVLNTYGTLLMNRGDYKMAEEVLQRGNSVVATLTEDDWGDAYPGNDPRVYGVGLTGMRKSYADNLALLKNKIAAVDKIGAFRLEAR